MKNIKFVLTVLSSSPLIYLMVSRYSPGPVSSIDSWPHGIKFARWRDHDIPTNRAYNTDWERIARGLHLDRGQRSNKYYSQSEIISFRL